MKRILIAIPSKNRAEILVSHVLSWLTRTPFEYKVFIEPQDKSAYYQYTHELVVLPENNRGLGFSKQQIGEYAKENGYDLIFKIDDDVSGWVGRGKGAKKYSAVNFQKLVADCIATFEKHSDVKAISFPYRNELFEIKKWSGVNARLQTCYIVRIEDWHADENLSIFEDFAQYVYIRSRNGVTLRYGLFGQDCDDVGKVAGGHQDFDRKKQSLEAITYLKQLYPALQVRKVERPWLYEPALKGEFFSSKKL